MSLFSYYNLPSSEIVKENITCNWIKKDRSNMPRGLWIIWPVILVLFEFIFEFSAENNIFSKINRRVQKLFEKVRSNEEISDGSSSANSYSGENEFIDFTTADSKADVITKYVRYILKLIIELMFQLPSGANLFLCMVTFW